MRRHHKSIWSGTAVSIGISAAAGTAGVFLCTLFFSLLTFAVLHSISFAGFFSTAALIAGTIPAGWLCGHYRRRRGLAEGALCGMVMYVIMSAAGLVLFGSPIAIKKLLLLTACGAAGGVWGVNSKRPKHLRE